VDFARLGNASRRPVPLPTYPWQRRRHWLPLRAFSPLPPAAEPPAREGEARAPRRVLKERWDRWLYQMKWLPLPWSVAGTSLRGGGRWLILADEGGLGQRLERRLNACGERTTLLRGRELPASLPQDFWDRVIARQDDLPLRGVLHLWSLDAPPSGQTTLASLAAAESRGCLAVIELVSALARAGSSARLYLLTRGVHQVAMTESEKGAPVAVAAAPLWGLGKVLALEHPELWGRLIDLEPAPVKPADEEVALLAELPAGAVELPNRGIEL